MTNIQTLSQYYFLGETDVHDNQDNLRANKFEKGLEPVVYAELRFKNQRFFFLFLDFFLNCVTFTPVTQEIS